MTHKVNDASRAAIRKHYRAHKQYYLDKNIRQREGIKDLVRTLKDIPCADCKEQYPYYVMHFDHVGEKTINIAQVIQRGWSKKRILDEVSKCEVVCANCHAERTHIRLLSSTDRVPVFETVDEGAIPSGDTSPVSFVSEAPIL